MRDKAVIGSACLANGSRDKASLVMQSLLGAIFIVGLYGAPAVADSACQLQEMASLPADFGHGVVRVDVGVNGETVKFEISTGSNITVINRGLVRRLGIAIAKQQATIISSKGTRERDVAIVQNFKIGEMAAHANRLVVADENGDGTGDTVAGTLGQDYIGSYEMELDPTDNRVKLFLPTPCSDQMVYWWDEHFELPMTFDQYRTPTVHVTLDGKDFRALVETGSARSSIDFALARRVFDLPSDVQAAKGQNDDQDASLPSFAFKELVFGQVTLRNPKIALKTYHAADFAIGSHIRETIASETPVVIGMDILSKFHTMISYDSAKLYFTLPKERKLVQNMPPKP